MNRDVVGIIQARTGSERLPGKVLKPLAGQPMLARVVRRTARATRLNEIIVATTTSPTDDPIAALCQENNWPCFRGSEDDVLDRYYRAAQAYNAEGIARITSDCPLIEPAIIDGVVGLFSQGRWDYVSNTLEPRTFPRGLDVEVLTFTALERAWREDTNPRWREHVTPYIYRHPDRFRLRGFENTENYSQMRWTVDTPEDLELVRRIYDHFGHDEFAWRDTIRLLKHHPDWLDINRHVQQKSVGS